MYYMIGTIRDKYNDIIGYRILNYNKKKIMDATLQSIKKALENNTITIENLILRDGEVSLTGGDINKYTSLDTRGKLLTEPSVTLLFGNNADAYSIDNYIVARHTGEIFEESAEDLAVYNMSNGIVMEDGEYTIGIDSEHIDIGTNCNDKELDRIIQGYKSKCKIMGIDYLDIRALNKELVLYSVDKSSVEVSIPGFVTIIGDNAFQGCEDLVKVTMGNNIKHIGKKAFNGCINLGEIDIPEDIKIISKGTFMNCNSLRHIKMPDSVEMIDDFAFTNCLRLTRLKLSKNLKHIGHSALSYIGIKNIELPHGLEKLDDSCLMGCHNIIEILFPSTLKYIGENIITFCNNITELNLPNNIEIMGKNAFYDCHKLTSISYPTSLNILGEQYCNGANSLTKIKIPKRLSKRIKDFEGELVTY